MTVTFKSSKSLALAMKELGISQVLENEQEAWKEAYTAFAFKFFKERSFFMGEQVRQLWEHEGYPPPHHVNCWGAMWNSFVKKGWVVITDEFTASSGSKSNGRMQHFWRSTLYHPQKVAV